MTHSIGSRCRRSVRDAEKAKADIDLGKQRYRQMKSLIDVGETP